MIEGDFGSRYGKTTADDNFAKGVAKGVAVDYPKSAKTSSTMAFTFRTVLLNTCMCRQPTLSAKWRLPRAFQVHTKEPPEQ
jgi:hypothetical protein